LGRHSAKYFRPLRCQPLTGILPSARPSTRQNLFYFLKKILCRVPLRRHLAKCFFKLLCQVPLPSARGPALDNVFFYFFKKNYFVECPFPGTRQRPREMQFFTFHCNRQIYICIYIYIYTHIYINDHIYITNMHYISQSHAYFINPLEIHHKSTKVQHHKFIITSSKSNSSTSLLRRWRLQVWPPGLR
jgi:hypothetical protein